MCKLFFGKFELIRLVKSAAKICSSDVASLSEELTIYGLIKLALNGVISSSEKEFLHESQTNSSSATKPTSSTMHSMQTFLLKSIQLIGDLQVPGFVDEGISVDKSDYLELANRLISELTIPSSNLDTNLAENLRCWTIIVCAKCLFIGFYDPAAAYQWAKGFFNHFSKMRKVVVDKNVKHGSKLLADVDILLNLDVVSLLLEVVIILVEIQELVGNLDSCLSYLSEAIALTKVHSLSERFMTVTAHRNIVYLHALRIWYRTFSSRLLSSIEEVLAADSQTRSDAKGTLFTNQVLCDFEKLTS